MKLLIRAVLVTFLLLPSLAEFGLHLAIPWYLSVVAFFGGTLIGLASVDKRDTAFFGAYFCASTLSLRTHGCFRLPPNPVLPWLGSRIGGYAQ